MKILKERSLENITVSGLLLCVDHPECWEKQKFPRDLPACNLLHTQRKAHPNNLQLPSMAIFSSNSPQSFCTISPWEQPTSGAAKAARFVLAISGTMCPRKAVPAAAPDCRQSFKSLWSGLSATTVFLPALLLITHTQATKVAVPCEEGRRKKKEEVCPLMLF